MFNKNLERYYESFGKQVMNRAKSGLQKAKGSTKLENSIKFKVKKTSYGYAIEFLMDYYGNFNGLLMNCHWIVIEVSMDCY